MAESFINGAPATAAAVAAPVTPAVACSSDVLAWQSFPVDSVSLSAPKRNTNKNKSETCAFQ